LLEGGSEARDLDGLSHAELKGLVVRQWEEMVELQRMVAALRDEIARLKGGPGRPNIKPSGMEQATEPKSPGSSGNQRRGRGSTRSKLSVHEERTVKVAAPPRGSRFKGYTSFVVPIALIFRCRGLAMTPLLSGRRPHDRSPRTPDHRGLLLPGFQRIGLPPRRPLAMVDFSGNREIFQ
jgi:hypothetical protein